MRQRKSAPPGEAGRWEDRRWQELRRAAASNKRSVPLVRSVVEKQTRCTASADPLSEPRSLGPRSAARFRAEEFRVTLRHTRYDAQPREAHFPKVPSAKKKLATGEPWKDQTACGPHRLPIAIDSPRVPGEKCLPG